MAIGFYTSQHIAWCSRSSYNVTVNRLNAFTVPLLKKTQQHLKIIDFSMTVRGRRLPVAVVNLRPFIPVSRVNNIIFLSDISWDFKTLKCPTLSTPYCDHSSTLSSPFTTHTTTKHMSFRSKTRTMLANILNGLYEFDF
jgi:hypothetical protein